MAEPIEGSDKLAFYLAFVPYLEGQGAIPVAEAAAHFGYPEQFIRDSVLKIMTMGIPGETGMYLAQDLFDFGRNHYDRFGHLVQGFVPALAAREVLLRRSPLVPGKWLFFLVTCVTLAISATYALVEWATAVLVGEGAMEFLGTQGDPWDSQWDMVLALIGAIAAQLLLARVQDRELGTL